MSNHKGEGSTSFKHKSAQKIYWGVDVKTGDLLSIRKVQRGLQCGCVCPDCGTKLVAKQGDVRKKHFAHKDNNNCIYPNEFAIYQLTKKVLANIKSIMLPAATLDFLGANKPPEEISKPQLIELDESPEYRRKDNAYPPELLLNWNWGTLRILLHFERDLNKSDLEKLKALAQKDGYALLKYDVPVSSKAEAFTENRIMEMLLSGSKASWLYNRNIESKRKKYIQAARTPVKRGKYFDCPIHKGYINGQYRVSIASCWQCEYNISNFDSPQCLAFGGYETLADFKLDEKARLAKMARIREKNDSRIQQELQERERREQERKQYAERMQQEQRRKEQEQLEKKRERQAQAEQARREQKQVEARRIANIIETFDATVEKPFYDEKRQRWVKCEKCGAVKPDYEFSTYRFRTGKCRVCNRQSE